VACHTQDVRYQLHDDKEDQHGYQLLQTQLSQLEKRQEEGRAVLPFLEAYLLSLTCDDPGTIIGPQLVLPLLQERLDAKAQEYHQQKLNHKKQEVALLLYPAFDVMCQTCWSAASLGLHRARVSCTATPAVMSHHQNLLDLC